MNLRPTKLKVFIVFLIFSFMFILPSFIKKTYEPVKPNCIPFYDKSGRCQELQNEYIKSFDDYTRMRHSMDPLNIPFGLIPALFASLSTMQFALIIKPIYALSIEEMAGIFYLILFPSVLAYYYLIAAFVESHVIKKQ